MFQPWELREIIKFAGVQLRAMIYLGLNGGFGNNDFAMLPISAVDFKRGWINCPRRRLASTAVARSGRRRSRRSRQR